jgi:hypothetical protein
VKKRGKCRLRCRSASIGACAAISFIDDLVFKSIDEALAGILGITVRDAVYLALLTNLSLTRDELPYHLDKFEQLLENTIGRRAAYVIFRAIAKRLYSELKLIFVAEPSFRLTDYVLEAKLRLMKPSLATAEKPDNEKRTCKKPLGNGDPYWDENLRCFTA